MATEGAITESANEQDLSALSEQLGIDLTVPRYKELAQQNGLLDPKGADQAQTGDTENNRDAGEAGENTAAEPQAGQDTDGKSKDWRSTAEENNWPKGFRKNLERLERQRARERSEFDARLKEMQAKMERLLKPQTPEQKISRNMFHNDEDYIEAVAVQKAEKAEALRQEREAKIRTEREAYENQAKSWGDKVAAHYSDAEAQAKYAEALADLRADFGHDLSGIDKRVTEYVFKSPVGPRMLEYFAGRPDSVAQLSQLHDWDLARTLQAVAAHVSQPAKPATQKQAPAAPSRQVSRAPGPIGTLGNSGSPIDAGGMTLQQQLAYYRKHGKMPGE